MRRSFWLITATATLFLSAPIAVSVHAKASTPQAPTLTANQTASRAAAAWLAGQLTNGDHMTSGDFDDHGLTAETVLALSSARVAGSAATKATDWLARPENTAAYLGDGVAESYAGAHAKLALTAMSQGRDPESFGGRKILTELAALQEDSGRYSDKSQYGNYSNAFSQSIAIIALQRTPAGAPANAVEFLATSQCADGSFPLNFGGDTCAGSVDATGLAAQAMLAAKRDAQAERALTWLAANQSANGGYAEGGSGATVVNANSTGSALQALNAGKHSAAAKAAEFLRELQVNCSGPREQQGAITYDGIFNVATDKRATVGGLLGLNGLSMMDISNAGSDTTVPSVNCQAAEQSQSSTLHPTAVAVSGAPGAPGQSTPAAAPADDQSAPSIAKTQKAFLKLPVTGTALGMLFALGACCVVLGTCAIAVTRRRAT